jgi:hypothetical protein
MSWRAALVFLATLPACDNYGLFSLAPDGGFVVTFDAPPADPPDFARGPDFAVDNGPGSDVAENVESTWEVGEAAGDAIQPCNPMATGNVSLAGDRSRVATGAESVRVDYGASYYFEAAYPRGRTARWDLTSRTGVAFLLDASLGQFFGGWQPDGPTVVLCGDGGAYRRFDPPMNLLPTSASGFTELRVPLAGGGGWTSMDSGAFNLARVHSIEWHADPLRGAGQGPARIWLDNVRFY